jgi:hypothetical protein
VIEVALVECPEVRVGAENEVDAFDFLLVYLQYIEKPLTDVSGFV